MSDKPNKPRRSSGVDRERAAKMRAAYTNPYKTVSAAQRRVRDELYEERDALRESPRERRERRDDGEMSHEMIEQALRNPTKFVTEAELREQYHHVLNDVRNMGLLAGSLMIVLVVLALLLPR